MNSEVRMYYPDGDYSDKELDNVWDVQTDGVHITAVADYLKNESGIAEEGVGLIVSTAAYGLGLCPDPAVKTDRQETGLVIGKVQSGKTSCFISLIALAFDNGYNLVIVFGGTKDKLLDQTKERLKEYFHNDCSDVIIVDTKSHEDIINAREIQKFLDQGKKIIIIGLKNTKQINKIRERVFGDGSLASKEPVLVIDDEGDEASLNTYVDQGKKSSTYKTIEKLKNVLPRHCFLSITATPQANLLISALDILSPDFGILVKPGEGYCGLDIFHSNSNYTVIIPKDEPSVLEEGFPESLYQALAMFFVACSVHKRRGMPAGKVSMLIHPSAATVDHSIVNKKVQNVIDEWQRLASDKKDVAYKQLRERFVAAYNDYKNSDSPAKLPEFKELEDEIKNALQYCKCHVVNSKKGAEISDEYYDYNIYIGGNMLGRGLTFKGLTITYIIRTSKGTSNVDTQEQRARWFGYRDKYLDICRIFASKKIINEFSLIRDHEEDLWATLEEAHMQGTRFKNISRIFSLGEGLRMTRTNVAKTEKYSFKYWNRQRIFMRDKDLTKSNEKIISVFKNKQADNIEIEECGSGEPYELLKDMEFSVVKESLLDKYEFPIGSTFNNSVIDKLAIQFSEKNLTPKVDVIWMRYKKPSRHFVNDDGRIDNYVVGRRPKEKEKPSIYLGDDNQFKRPSVMQVQLHLIQDKNTNDISPVLSLYIPPEIADRLADLVSRA